MVVVQKWEEYVCFQLVNSCRSKHRACQKQHTAATGGAKLDKGLVWRTNKNKTIAGVEVLRQCWDPNDSGLNLSVCVEALSHTLPTLLCALRKVACGPEQLIGESCIRNRTLLVEGSSAALRATQTWDFVLFNGELVIIRDLLVYTDRLLGVYHNLLLGLDGDHFGVAVGLWKRRTSCE